MKILIINKLKILLNYKTRRIYMITHTYIYTQCVLHTHSPTFIHSHPLIHIHTHTPTPSLQHTYTSLPLIIFNRYVHNVHALFGYQFDQVTTFGCYVIAGVCVHYGHLEWMESSKVKLVGLKSKGQSRYRELQSKMQHFK